MKKILEQVFIQDMVAGGKCIARVNNKVVFVEGTQSAPQDLVDLQVIRSKKKYAEAVVTHWHQLSPFRVEPFCQHFGTCGGCQWQHISYEKQLAYKQQQVIDNLQRIGKLDLPPIRPIIGSKSQRFYRNKLEFAFSNRRWLTAQEIQQEIMLEKSNALGFHLPKHFDKVLDIEKCYLQPDLSNQIRLAIKQYALDHNLSFFDIKNKQGFLRNLLIRNTLQGEWLVLLSFFEDKPHEIEKLLTFVANTFPQITSLLYVINSKKNDTIHDLEIHLFKGNSYITEEMPCLYSEKPLQFRIGVKSFYQTNSEQAFQLYKAAAQMADLQGHEIVYDLYTGIGTIALFVARKAQKVIGLEYIHTAVEDAKINAQLNGIENTYFLAGDIKDLLTDQLFKQYGNPDVLITDPPRAGMHPQVVKTILQAEPSKIVYVSCNPTTQARDLALLAQKYMVTAVQPVDMFPHTSHVENVVGLQKRT
ncbi:MAG: 23S rRNA (uracil(1939)-C(5))-methyltransferase RlmD [Microscillaceae bacterium]|nr:23S rRNA (uracil(1939)-C(5))-methyltransferase RlmD [Microscillaceae bacterium]MDW8460307.1 23S rRNA (uracil(1939)-C(5))-methyltransferase RlmD [Cytophagales bacterium]